MQLVHYSKTPLRQWDLEFREQTNRFKPRGLWVSDEEAEQSWTEWCQSEDFALDCFNHASEVKLMRGAKILKLRTAKQIIAFTDRFALPLYRERLDFLYINWAAVAQCYDGILITPYQWSLRLDPRTFWYYSWDCASGCIWHPRAIRELKRLPTPELQSRAVLFCETDQISLD